MGHIHTQTHSHSHPHFTVQSLLTPSATLTVTLSYRAQEVSDQAALGASTHREMPMSQRSPAREKSAYALLYTPFPLRFQIPPLPLLSHLTSSLLPPGLHVLLLSPTVPNFSFYPCLFVLPPLPYLPSSSLPFTHVSKS